MAIINEDRLTGRIMTWTGGRVLLAVAGAGAIGFVLGLLFG